MTFRQKKIITEYQGKVGTLHMAISGLGLPRSWEILPKPLAFAMGIANAIRKRTKFWD